MIGLIFILFTFRFQRTFKSKLFKAIAYNGTYRYIDFLESLVKEYNNTPHRGIGFRKPISINSKQKEKLLLKTVYNRPKVFIKGKFKVGNYVRIGDHRGVFDKGYEPNYSTAIFVISQVRLTNPVTYKVKNKETNVELKRSYYEYELKKVKHPDVYLIKKVLAKRGSKVLVSWLGYSDAHNQWINIKDIV